VPYCVTTEVALLTETSTEYGRSLLRGILRYSRLHGPWSLYVVPEHLDRFLPPRGSWPQDGILGRTGSLEIVRRIQASGLPFVVSSFYESQLPRVGPKSGEIRTDCDAIAHMAADHLRETGLRRFAFCGFDECHWSLRREEAFIQALRARGFPCAVYRIALANWMHWPHWIGTWKREQAGLANWLQTQERPLGLMACNDTCGWEVISACLRTKLKVPEEVAVIGVDNDEIVCELSEIQLSSVALNIEDAGYRGAKLLEGLMRGTHVKELVAWVHPTHVVTRRSTDVISQGDPLVAAALKIIREQTSIGVPDIIRQLGQSRRTLERRFLHSVGRTVLSEIRRRQLQRAKQALLETDWPLHLIAPHAGFGSSRAFFRTFRREEGCSPQTFRERPGVISGNRCASLQVHPSADTQSRRP